MWQEVRFKTRLIFLKASLTVAVEWNRNGLRRDPPSAGPNVASCRMKSNTALSVDLGNGGP